MSSAYLAMPLRQLFKFPPDSQPQALPPPPVGSTLSAPPFSIPLSWYTAVLDIRVPITIAGIYAVTVTALNAYNRSRGNKPWRISKTKPFFWFVVAHNVFLAVYSAWTFVGMWQALKNSIQHPNGPAGLVGTVDSFCKIHGPSGPGNAIAYNATSSQWTTQSPYTVRLTEAGEPHSTDVGRMWNEGLAFYGWWFYLSKFYEVLDTVIILAKGKRSSTLQTYHHAGAMMCMWAGIRYMSAPIWMFCFVNSGIHALMYTYYTLTAFAVPIPNRLKRSLTTMQIIQFIIGVAFATLHSFVFYSVPVQVPNSLQDSVKAATSVASSAVSSVAAAATSAGLASKVKTYLFRAAGEEGLAGTANGRQVAEAHSRMASAHGSGSGASYHTEYQTIPCVDTSGQTFAIWLNVLYLTPLTVLFVRFFIRSYIRRTTQKHQHVPVVQASEDAIKGLDRKIYQNGGLVNGNANGHVANGKPNGHVANGKANGHVANGKASRKH
ncbi:Elongation of fatty acids protein [Venustampulla echinocandica]|uniref:Elongation of fatty acids protein n=1 Tax=Venustampulla echinocandica TaxID=2656787 RepID=A0A370TUU0_9HELO|nr:Elongation of fatty acids protein [Venustampulla echinocandica]RDL39291.1 Elongation of fatty acids protein [Venustampulla echinocandica]